MFSRGKNASVASALPWIQLRAYNAPRPLTGLRGRGGEMEKEGEGRKIKERGQGWKEAGEEKEKDGEEKGTGSTPRSANVFL